MMPAPGHQQTAGFQSDNLQLPLDISKHSSGPASLPRPLTSGALPRQFPAGDRIDGLGRFLPCSALSGRESLPSSSSLRCVSLGKTSNKLPLIHDEKGLERERGSQHLGDPPPNLSSLGSIGLSSSPPVAPL
ncbi:Mandelate racemase [Dissostichus eleginoides]|uniref:Mandelate racemase n=1 Tax=Dissostichus eleginoides TaxID=100907 RepID=A0AAD9CAL4_DISEL|nr:Mandelate racemase [Dissostichus eleginoides]